MIRILIAVTVLAGVVILAGVEDRQAGADPGQSGPVSAAMHAGFEIAGKLPLRFEANHGQIDASVRFLCRAGGGRIFIRPDEAVMAGQGVAVAMKLLGADAGARVVGEEALPGVTNYLKGNDRSRWVTGVPGYRRVVSEAVYPGIDIGYRGQEQSLEYDFIVAPGADPACIRLGFEGADGLEIDASGNLMIRVGDESIVHQAPRVYQETSGEQEEIAGRFVLRGDFEVGFEVEDYDLERSLVVDPVIEFSTYLGGSGNDYVIGVAVDDQGYVYVTGDTFSADFPTTLGAFDTVFDQGGYEDLFVTKLSSDGSALIYSTYIGGDVPVTGETVAEDNAWTLAVDGNYQAHVAGATRSVDFPTAGTPYDPDANGSIDAFVLILNDLGTDLAYSTYLGGAEYDIVTDLALHLGDIYLTGGSYSPNLETGGAFSGHTGNMDAFVAALDPTAGAAGLLYFTYLGAAYRDVGRSIAVDDSGDAYIVGESTNVKRQPQFPTTADAFLPEMRIRTTAIPSPFLSRVRPGGAGAADLVYSTFFKNPDTLESLYDVAVDAYGQAYVTGYTLSTKWPTTPDAFAASNTGHADAVVTVIDTDLAGDAGLVYSTYIGGSEQDVATVIALDSGHLYVSGRSSADYPGTSSPIPFPTTFDAFLTTPASDDVFLLKLDATVPGAAGLLFSTLIGGEDADSPYAIALAGPDDVYLAGSTASTAFPVTIPSGTPGGDLAGGTDAFVMRVTLGSPPVPPAAPTGLSATAISSSAIALSWTDNAGNEDGFEIERSPDGSSWVLLATKAAEATSHDDTGLQPDATWYYRVRAFNGEGESAWSNEVGATTFATGGGPALATGETTVDGTVIGNYTDTHAADAVVEAIEEVESGGKPSKRTTYLEHRWSFLLPAPAASGDHQLQIEGWCSGEEDTFAFDYSTDGQSWVSAGAVISSTTSTTVTGSVDGTISGTLYIRVVDTDQTPGNRTKDRVSIDFMQIVTP